MGWQIAPALLNFTGVSGHAASATSVYLSLSLLVSHGAPRRRRLLVVGATSCLVLLIAASRLVVKVHSPSELVFGVALGIVTTLLFARGLATAGKLPRPLAGRPWMALLLALVMLAANGKPAPTQDLLMRIAMSLSGRSSVYGRLQPL
ncbi:PAP2 superfamily protein [Herbaspirillum sp. YR522]|nr:PAP2 superfamily protein [Herbaspirillum sp. YR522]